ncbi:MAG TPA: PilZ domain-containing protein [Sphingomicrobium sp.]|nr:PilZ domain-containing protein [Sphingomicrobium sp.]
MQELLGLKPREPRRKVMIKARMREGASWSDALILNMSSRGLLVRSDRSPSRGSYLEIRRGPYVIVARVVWSNSGRFGVQTQDAVPADDLIEDPDREPSRAKSVATALQERRLAQRPADERLNASRHRARLTEFVAISAVLGSIAVLAAQLLAEVVARPLDAVQAALSAPK